MVTPKKLIVVTASYDPLRKRIMRIVNNVASQRGLEIKVKEEDWIFLSKYGEKDELGGASIPQVFIEYDDGSIKHVLTRVPLNERGRPDNQAAESIILRALQE